MFRWAAPFTLLVVAASSASAQFVWPKAEYHDAEPGLYKEDPFISSYRQKFFAVFKGDVASFEKAYSEVQEMVKKDPKDARALVWVGNGHTVKAGLLHLKKHDDEAYALLEESRRVMDRAVSMRPKDPNIYMMQAATLYIQGQFFPADKLPRSVWTELRDDCLKFITYFGPKKMPKVSTHLRGETYGELGIAYLKLGDKTKAKQTFEALVQLCPNTDYSARAKKELEKLSNPEG